MSVSLEQGKDLRRFCDLDSIFGGLSHKVNIYKPMQTNIHLHLIDVDGYSFA